MPHATSRTTRWTAVGLLCSLLLAACDRDGGASSNKAGASAPEAAGQSLADARRGFRTKLTRKELDGDPAPQPPPDLFWTVRYDSPAGKLVAYLSPPPADGGKHPAIIWLFGGFSNGIGETAWEPAAPDNDQSARSFREAGVVMMYPSLRGGNDNPGVREGFFGEVDDVLAAADFLARQAHVDPQRIYLGGHSTGGTLALLAAAVAPPGRFRAVVAFGPAADTATYGPDNVPFDVTDEKERSLRAPVRWVRSTRTPVFVLEGTAKPSNLPSLKALAAAARGNDAAHFHAVDRATHFSILAPATKLIASKILRDEGPTTNLTFTDAELGDMVRP